MSAADEPTADADRATDDPLSIDTAGIERDAEAAAELRRPSPCWSPPAAFPRSSPMPRAWPRSRSGLAEGTGPVALDAERASGYRYGQRAYLSRSSGRGPAASSSTRSTSTDLGADRRGPGRRRVGAARRVPGPGCLAELGLRPRSLFDTELAGRIAGKPRVGLGPLVEQVLGLRLEKGHGAADWSTRPLPEPWLRYAALDVEVLVELRDALAADLERAGQGRLGARGVPGDRRRAAALTSRRPVASHVGPAQASASRAALAIVREMWILRDELARRRDVAPGSAPARHGDRRGRARRSRHAARHCASSPDSAAAGRSGSCASGTRRSAGPARCRRRNGRPRRCRRTARHRRGSGPNATSPPPPDSRRPDRPSPPSPTSTTIPVENLLSPDSLRRLCWTPPWTDDTSPDTDAAAQMLTGLGARRWQCTLVVTAVCRAIARSASRAPADRASIEAVASGADRDHRHHAAPWGGR